MVLVTMRALPRWAGPPYGLHGTEFSKLCRLLLFLNAVLGVLLGTPSKGEINDKKPFYRPFAFVDINAPHDKADLVFDKLTARLKHIAKIDMNDFRTTEILKMFGVNNPQRLDLQYVDESGAKIQLGQLTLQASGLPRGSPYKPGVHYVVIDLGYAENAMPDEMVAAKVTQLVKEAESACKAADTACVITHRLAEPTKF